MSRARTTVTNIQIDLVATLQDQSLSIGCKTKRKGSVSLVNKINRRSRSLDKETEALIKNWMRTLQKREVAVKMWQTPHNCQWSSSAIRVLWLNNLKDS